MKAPLFFPAAGASKGSPNPSFRDAPLVLTDALAKYLGFALLGEEQALWENFEGYELASKAQKQAESRFAEPEWNYLLAHAEDAADKAYFRERLAACQKKNRPV